MILLAYAISSLWTLIAVTGVCVSTWALIDSLIDRRARERRGTDGLQIAMIVMNLRGAHASLYLHTFFLILGGLALARPTPFELSPMFILLAGGYIFVAAANVRAVGLNQLDRLKLRKNSPG